MSVTLGVLQVVIDRAPIAMLVHKSVVTVKRLSKDIKHIIGSLAPEAGTAPGVVSVKSIEAKSDTAVDAVDHRTLIAKASPIISDKDIPEVRPNMAMYSDLTYLFRIVWWACISLYSSRASTSYC